MGKNVKFALETLKPKSKIRKTLEYILAHGSITSWDAIMAFNYTRLSDAIYTLRKKYNLNIVSISEASGNPKMHYVRYILED